tara:strand:+ start:590 stop:961 length:372 start_codon:yes stop_codon:yes gene_type:complete
MKKIKTLGLSIITGAILGSSPAIAGSFLGAEYQVGKNKVAFLSEQSRIAGNVFLPPDYNRSNSYPALVVITPASGVKEQTAGIYAEKLAKKGYITLAFDHRTYGESGGFPRGMENALMKVEDI